MPKTGDPFSCLFVFPNSGKTLTFEIFCEWMEQHKDEETGIYRKPLTSFKRDGKTISVLKDMTEEEQIEYKIGAWWSRYPKERQIYEKNIGRNLEELSEQEIKIIEIYYENFRI